VPDQNTIRVYVSARTGEWVARIGPPHESVQVEGGSPDQAIMFLMLKMKHDRYRFDHHSVLDI
jgi:hypothetical protein